MMKTFWMVGDPGDGTEPLVATQYAQLFGLECRLWRRDDLPERRGAKAADTVVALSYPALRALDSAQTARLRNFVRAGATLYLRGGFTENERCTLWPLVDVAFSCADLRPASAYRAESHPSIPTVLREEECASGRLTLPSAFSLPERARPLVSAL
jgi:hypothetical protein